MMPVIWGVQISGRRIITTAKCMDFWITLFMRPVMTVSTENFLFKSSTLLFIISIYIYSYVGIFKSKVVFIFEFYSNDVHFILYLSLNSI